MIKRGLSALVGVSIFLALCFGGLLPFAVGVTIVAGLAAREWIVAYVGAQQVEGKSPRGGRLPAWQNGINILLVCAGLAIPLLAYAAQQKHGIGKKNLMDGLNAGRPPAACAVVCPARADCRAYRQSPGYPVPLVWRGRLSLHRPADEQPGMAARPEFPLRAIQ